MAKRGLVTLSLIGIISLGGSTTFTQISSTPQENCFEGLGSVWYPQIFSCGGGGSAYAQATQDFSGVELPEWMLDVTNFITYVDEIIDNTMAMIEVINDLPSQILASMTPLEIAAEIISAVSTLADMAYNAGQVVYDLANGTLGWHNLFNLVCHNR